MADRQNNTTDTKESVRENQPGKTTNLIKTIFLGKI